MAQTDTKEIIHPYIVRNPEILGGEPTIQGTRIGVRHLAEWDRQGYSVDEMVSMYPHLTHAQVHDALSFAFDHKAEIDLLIEENKTSAIKAKFQDRSWLK